MLYCKNCKKEVVIFAIPSGVEGADEIVEGQRKDAEKKGYFILFNPPPENVEPYKCPVCHKELEQK